MKYILVTNPPTLAVGPFDTKQGARECRTQEGLHGYNPIAIIAPEFLHGDDPEGEYTAPELLVHPAAVGVIDPADAVQYARLLAEILATHDKIDIVALSEAMDLEDVQVEELFDRAQADWDMIKERI